MNQLVIARTALGVPHSGYYPYLSFGRGTNYNTSLNYNYLNAFIRGLISQSLRLAT